MRPVLATLVLLLSSAPPVSGQWLPAGVPLCANICGGNQPILCTDGAGGAFVTWVNGDVYVQHVMFTGNLAPGWPASGIPLCTAADYQGPEAITGDGVGGAIVAWIDYRTSVSTGIDIYAQRVTGAGQIVPGWPLNGAPVTRAVGDQDLPVAAPDGAGGAFIAWEDDRPARDVYAQHLSAAGSIAEGWPADGLALTTAAGLQAFPVIVADGGDGALIAWHDHTVLGVYAQHITTTGAVAPGWSAGGQPVVSGKGWPRMVSDGAGAVLIGCSIRNGNGEDLEYYVQRYTFAGMVVPGWPAGGVRVCTAADTRDGLRAASDARDGILLAWQDYRDYDSAASDIYAARVQPDGSLAPGWSANGVRVTNRPEFEYAPDIAPDGTGGAYLCWRREGADGFRILIQHLTATGAVAPGWLPNGIGVGTSSEQFDPRIATDGRGGSIVAWEERSLGGVYAQRFVMDGIVPVLLALVRAEVEADRVALTWHGAEAAGLEATVYRRTGKSDWLRLDTVTADGTGLLRYEDRAVSSGERYAYRLGYAEAGGEAFTVESWVEVPALTLALEGVRPNPAVGAVHVWFTLPDARPATLELLDVSGRRVVAQEVGALGAGRHVVRLDHGAAVSAGLYWVSLRQGGRTLRARAAVIR